MIDNTPLGRGLSSLINADQTSIPITDVGTTEQHAQPIENLYANPDQPRKLFSAEALEELSQSIAKNGILQPILVRPHPVKSGSFEIVAGERRWQAAQKAGLIEIPVIVKELDDSDVIEIALIENIHRRDLNAIEEAQGYRTLIEDFDYTQEKVAATIKKSRSHIANLLRLLKLPTDIQDMISNQQLSAGHARALIGAQNPKTIAQQIIDQGLNVRQTEILISAKKDISPQLAKQTPARKNNYDANIAERQEAVAAYLGMPVKISSSGENGKITISYRTLEEFDAIYHALTQYHRP